MPATTAAKGTKKEKIYHITVATLWLSFAASSKYLSHFGHLVAPLGIAEPQCLQYSLFKFMWSAGSLAPHFWQNFILFFISLPHFGQYFIVYSSDLISAFRTEFGIFAYFSSAIRTAFKVIFFFRVIFFNLFF